MNDTSMVTGKAIDIVTYLMGDDIDKNATWDLTIHQEKKKRSLDSNAYFHKLVHMLAQAQDPPISLAKCKNLMLERYGQPDYINDNQVVIKSNLPPETMEELEYIHAICVKVAEEKGNKVYFYRIYRGSHTYSTSEMSKLIKGTVFEAQQMGIETATPEELQHMQDLYDSNIKKRNN